MKLIDWMIETHGAEALANWVDDSKAIVGKKPKDLSYLAKQADEGDTVELTNLPVAEIVRRLSGS